MQLDATGFAHDAVLDDVKRLLALEPNAVDAHVARSVALMARDRPEPAEDAAYDAIAVGPDDPRGHLQRARVRLERTLGNVSRDHSLRRREGALVDAERAVALAPDLVEAYEVLARAARSLERHDVVAKACTHVLRLRPGDRTALRDRACARGKLGDGQGQVEDLAALLILGPDDASMYVSRASARLEQQDHRGAIEDCTRALALDPTTARALQLRASARRALGDLVGAETDARAALEADPTDRGARAVLLRVRLATKDWITAEKELGVFIALHPDDPFPWSMRAHVRGQQGNRAGALADQQKAIALDAALPRDER